MASNEQLPDFYPQYVEQARVRKQSAAIGELNRITKRLHEIAEEAHHWRASDKLETAAKRVAEGVEALGDGKSF